MNSTSVLMAQQPSAPAPVKEQRRGEPAIGAAIISFFGTCWLAMGCAVDPHGSVAILAGIIVCGALLIGASVLVHRATKSFGMPESAIEKAHRERVFRNVNIAQWVAIPVLIALLNMVGLTQWIAPGIILVVGLHFIPLARLFARTENLITAFIFIAIAVVGPWVMPGGPTSSALPIAAGVTLWIGALFGLRAALKRRA